jgi:hypothetical protein
LVQRLPKAERPVAGGEFGIKHEPVLVAQAEQELAPALGALPPAILDREQLLPAARVGADQHQHALALVLEPWGEVDAVGPEIDVAPGGEVAPLPAHMLLLPSFRETPHRRCRQARRLGPEQRRQGLAELTRGHALQVKPGQQLLHVLRPA